MKSWLAAAVKNMKSSPRIVPAAQGQSFSAWNMDDLDAPQSESRAAELEAILAMFRAPEDREPIHGLPIAARAVAWTPEEFDQEDLYEPPAQEFIEEKYEAGAPETADSYAALANAEHEAQAILENARAQATEVMLQAQRTADELISDARKEIAAARDAAYREGIEAAHNEAVSWLQAAQAVVEEAKAWKEQLVDQSAPLIIEMVVEIARKLFGDGVALSDHALQLNLNRVLTNAKSLGDLIIYLNPQDAATLDSAWRDMRSMTTGSRVRILPAEEITRGGCYIQGQMGAIDARVETQMRTVLDAFTAVTSDEERD